MIKTATISTDGLYRYDLTRRWATAEHALFIMLNPSTADAELDDPTIRRCIGFAQREGCGGVTVINLYALRATKPAHLLDHPDPEGPENPMAWAQAIYDTPPAFTVAAWGAFDHPDLPDSLALRGCSTGLLCLGTTQEGRPRHPLYVRADAELRPWGRS